MRTLRRLSVLLALAALLAPLAAAQAKKIVLTASPRHGWAFTEEAMEGYRKAAGSATLVFARTDADLAREIVDADGVIGGVSQAQFKTTRKLKWVQTFSAGVEDYRWPEFLASDVVLTNCKIVQGPTIADHAMAMLLAFTRGLHRYIPGRTREEWDRDNTGLDELEGKTAVVIGTGGIGLRIAERAHAFGMTVIGVDPKDIAPVSFLARAVYPDQLDSVLPQADVVFVSAPHTPESERMMGPRQFDLMKQGSYFIAVSRGKLYDTSALVKALDSRRLAGAGLDVTDPEPLPKGHPLWKFPNVIVTPHIASQAPGGERRRIGVVTENIRRFARGEHLINVVDKQKGY